MKAAIIREFGDPHVLQMEETPIPKPKSGELLVKMLSTSINHRDVFIREGHKNPAFDVDLPITLGIDVCGIVEETGDGVDTFKSGDRVIANPFLPCGKCNFCLSGKFRFCPNYDIYNGSYAEYAVIKSENAVKISSDVPIQHAAAFSNSYITAWQMLVGKAKVGPADTVFIWAGTSGLGSAAVEIAKLAGARVIVSAGSEEKLEMLKAYNPDLIVNHYDSKMLEKIEDFTNGEGVSIVFETIGTASWERSVEMSSFGGTIVTAGCVTGDTVTMNIVLAFVKELRILGSMLGTMEDLNGSVRHLNNGYFQPMIDQVFPLDEVARAHELMEQGKSIGKIIIEI